MKIIRPSQCHPFIAGDGSILREILNPRKDKTKISYSLAMARVKKKRETRPHCLKYTEVYHILDGKGIMHIDGQKETVKKGDTIYIPAGAVQHIENPGNTCLEFMCIVNPPWRPACEKTFEKNGSRSKRSRH